MEIIKNCTSFLNGIIPAMAWLREYNNSSAEATKEKT